MSITVDTNVLVRAVTLDDSGQSKQAVKLLESAPLIAVTLTTLCELTWVLGYSYGYNQATIAQAIQRLLDSPNVKSDRMAAQFGLSVMASGGDFADGIMAHQGTWLGGETFVSFDKKAVRALSSLKQPAVVLSSLAD